ncbi:hypothetical protein [Psychrobium sp. 1_MG-2023]|nr:hypothetical protein [Psychrobium sp. 1_MG-2023]MDP2561393.1 hypothetical protein [Psychrobium sp. 1_MG-2023]
MGSHINGVRVVDSINGVRVVDSIDCDPIDCILETKFTIPLQ